MDKKKQNNSWINALNQAKEILNLKGFHLVKKNTKLYSLAKKIQSGGAADLVNLVESDKPGESSGAADLVNLVESDKPSESFIPQKKYVIDDQFKKRLTNIIDGYRNDFQYTPITSKELHLLLADLVHHIPANLEEGKESANIMSMPENNKKLSEILRDNRLKKQKQQLNDLTQAQLEEIDFEDYTSIWSGSVIELRKYMSDPNNAKNVENYLPLIDIIKQIESQHDRNKVHEFKIILGSFFDIVYKLNLNSEDILKSLRPGFKMVLTQLLFDPLQTIAAFKALSDLHREYVESGKLNNITNEPQIINEFKERLGESFEEFSRKYRKLWEDYQKNIQSSSKFTKTQLNLCNYRYEKEYSKNQLLKLKLKESTKMIKLLESNLQNLNYKDTGNINTSQNRNNYPNL